MIFVCFSAKDSQSPIGELLQHMEKFALPVMYDPERASAEEDFNLKGFSTGIEKSRYAVILLTPNSVSSACVQEEIHQIYAKYQNRNMKVFPILYGVKKEELPSDMQYFTEMMYYETDSDIEIYDISNHIVSHILMNELEKYQFRAIQQFILHNQSIPLMTYPTSLLNAYSAVDDETPAVKVALLYALQVYIKNSYNINAIPKFYYAGIHKFFDITRLRITVDEREMIIMERMILLLLNAVLFGYQS